MDSDDEKIRARAYELWDSNGRQHGRDEEHWLQAERELGAAGARAAGAPILQRRPPGRLRFKRPPAPKAMGPLSRLCPKQPRASAVAPSRRAKPEATASTTGPLPGT